MQIAQLDPSRIVKSWDFRSMSAATLLEEFITRYIWDRDTIINRERQYYADPRQHYNPFALTEEGLIIRARRRRTDENFTQQEYLSGLISNHSKGGILPPVTDGVRRVTCVLSMPVGIGVWPAWWFLPEFEQWPAHLAGRRLPEIDAGEYTGRDGVYKCTVHSRGTGDVLNSTKHTHECPDLSLTVPREYTFERSANLLKFGFEGEWKFVTALPVDLIGPLHFNLNLAIGGGYAEMDSGIPHLDSYALKCQKIEVFDVPAELSGDVPNVIAKPNEDIVNRLQAIRAQQLRTLPNPIDEWIGELIEL